MRGPYGPDPASGARQRHYSTPRSDGVRARAPCQTSGGLGDMATQTQSAVNDAAADETSQLTAADRRELLRLMLLIREIESRGLQLYKQGKVPGSFYDG